MAFKVDPQKLLEKQARKFVPYWKEYKIETSNRLFFHVEQKEISLRFCEQKSLFNRNCLLTIRVDWHNHGSALSEEEGNCTIGRMGRWKLKGNDPFLFSLKDNLHKSHEFTVITKTLDYQKISFSHSGKSLSLEILLYGGGFVSMILPPLQFEVGIPDGQIQLLKNFIELIDSVVQSLR